MYQWYIELYVGHDILHIGEPFMRQESQSVVSFLTTLDDESFKVVKIGTYHFWVSPDFDSLVDEEQVLQCAENQLPIINGILQIKFDTNLCSVKIGDVYHPDTNGQLVRSAMRSTLYVSSYPDERFFFTKDAQTPSTLDILVMARNNPLIAEALQYFAMSHSWDSLMKVFDL